MNEKRQTFASFVLPVHCSRIPFRFVHNSCVGIFCSLFSFEEKKSHIKFRLANSSDKRTRTHTLNISHLINRREVNNFAGGKWMQTFFLFRFVLLIHFNLFLSLSLSLDRSRSYRELILVAFCRAGDTQNASWPWLTAVLLKWAWIRLQFGSKWNKKSPQKTRTKLEKNVNSVQLIIHSKRFRIDKLFRWQAQFCENQQLHASHRQCSSECERKNIRQQIKLQSLNWISV